MDYTNQLNQIINLLTQINNSVSVGGIVYNGLHYVIAYMIIGVIIVLIGFAVIYFFFKLFGVD
jgi:hypothetical protein